MAGMFQVTKNRTTLVNCLGGADNAGSKLKEAGITHWLAPNIGTNSSGFTALPGGFRNELGAFTSFCRLLSWRLVEASD